uniref:Uncharacterized protein n=2 Tax=Oryza sativa subsp. japonica TaxID=39947 RepID=Q69VA9_ORYSJ|nr:hypothetical protein [Oryza sativa Japonica Group]BAD30529.1 hypothetical protein [Oryza sativa Japonica Group]
MSSAGQPSSAEDHAHPLATPPHTEVTSSTTGRASRAKPASFTGRASCADLASLHQPRLSRQAGLHLRRPRLSRRAGLRYHRLRHSAPSRSPTPPPNDTALTRCNRLPHPQLAVRGRHASGDRSHRHRSRCCRTHHRASSHRATAVTGQPLTPPLRRAPRPQPPHRQPQPPPPRVLPRLPQTTTAAATGTAAVEPRAAVAAMLPLSLAPLPPGPAARAPSPAHMSSPRQLPPAAVQASSPPPPLPTPRRCRRLVAPVLPPFTRRRATALSATNHTPSGRIRPGDGQIRRRWRRIRRLLAGMGRRRRSPNRRCSPPLHA